MALKYFDNVKESSATTGTGTITLGGAVTGFDTFASCLADQDSCPYSIRDGNNWETGVGLFTSAGTTLARTVSDSSSAGAAITLSGSGVEIALAPIAMLARPSVTYVPSGVASLANGTAWTGTVNTQANFATIDNVPNIFTEAASGTLQIEVPFTGLGDITHIIVRMRYLDATAAHTISVKAYDYNAVAYSAALCTSTGINPNFDYYVIELTNAQRKNFKDASGNGKICFEHGAGTVAGHLLEIDYCVFKYNIGLAESTADPMPCRLINTQVLISGTTYTPTVGTSNVLIRGVAGGGGGGGATGGTTQTSCGGGGAGGGGFEHVFPIVSGQTCTYALGALGTGGTATGNGTAGGNTTFAVPVTDKASAVTATAYGGLGGIYLATGSTLVSVLGGMEGAATTGANVNLPGQPGYPGIRLSTTAACSGNGGNSLMGGGGNSRNTAGVGDAGSANGGYGGGGAGAMSTSATGYAGGAGAAGAIVVYEYS